MLAGGDSVIGPAIVIEAIAAGNKAAASICNTWKEQIFQLNLYAS